MLKLTSAKNPKYKYFKALMQKRARMENGEYTVEGIKSVNDAIRSGKEISAVIASDKFEGDTNFGKITVYEIPEDLFNRLCDTVTPQGIMAVIKMNRSDSFTPDIDKSYIYCDNVQDPGNMGTIIRTADAAGFAGVILSRGCVDIYSPKTVRASMGSFFNIDLITEKSAEDLISYKEKGFSVIGGILSDDSEDYRSADYTRPTIIAVGNEANGISDDVKKLCKSVKIPIIGAAESLNVSVAAGILMYEWMRNQRRR